MNTMYGWFVDLAGPTLGAVLFWLAAILLLILLFLGVYWLFRRAASSSFIAGGRNRRPRLAVIDVAAVDSRRRLVLVRRDDTEHLIMIGGPSDLVIEQSIRKRAVESPVPPEAPEYRSDPARSKGAARAEAPPVAMPEPVVERGLADPQIEPPLRAQPQPQSPASPPERRMEKTPPPRVEPRVESPGQPRPEPAVEIPKVSGSDFDTELLRELESDFEEKPKTEPARPEDTLSAIFADIIRKHRP